MSTKRLPESLRSRLEVATALAWEALVDAHVTQAASFVHLLRDRVPFEDALPRYLMEVDIGDSMGSAVRNRVLVMLDTTVEESDRDGTLELRPGATVEPVAADEDGAGWRRFRPDIVMREIRQRHKRDDATEELVKLALARAEEAVIATHVDNAITFAALLEGVLTFDRACQEYIDAVGLSGGRAQTVHQRTMARLADVHLPVSPPSRS